MYINGEYSREDNGRGFSNYPSGVSDYQIDRLSEGEMTDMYEYYKPLAESFEKFIKERDNVNV